MQTGFTMRLPTDIAELAAIPRLNPDPEQAKCVSRYEPGVLVKYAFDHADEVRALNFVYQKLSIHTPRVLHHPPFTGLIPIPYSNGDEGVWYFAMEECPGIPLDTAIDSMTAPELNHIAEQLSKFLEDMRSFTSDTLGSLSGGPYFNRFHPYPLWPDRALNSVEEFLEHVRAVFVVFCGEDYVDELLSVFPRNDAVHLVHGDLLPRNILVKGSTITAVIDWETAGFYPAFWEYCRMHYTGHRTPGWNYVLSRLFPGPRRDAQIASADAMIDLLSYNT